MFVHENVHLCMVHVSDVMQGPAFTDQHSGGNLVKSVPTKVKKKKTVSKQMWI